jgi:DNA-binding FadR family transcriptional regulator
MLLNIRFRHLAAYTPESVLQDHGRILKAIEYNDPLTAIELTYEISERVSGDCIQTLKAIQAENISTS